MKKLSIILSVFLIGCSQVFAGDFFTNNNALSYKTAQVRVVNPATITSSENISLVFRNTSPFIYYSKNRSNGYLKNMGKGMQFDCPILFYNSGNNLIFSDTIRFHSTLNYPDRTDMNYDYALTIKAASDLFMSITYEHSDRYSRLGNDGSLLLNRNFRNYEVNQGISFSKKLKNFSMGPMFNIHSFGLGFYDISKEKRNLLINNTVDANDKMHAYLTIDQEAYQAWQYGVRGDFARAFDWGASSLIPQLSNRIIKLETFSKDYDRYSYKISSASLLGYSAYPVWALVNLKQKTIFEQNYRGDIVNNYTVGKALWPWCYLSYSKENTLRPEKTYYYYDGLQFVQEDFPALLLARDIYGVDLNFRPQGWFNRISYSFSTEIVPVEADMYAYHLFGKHKEEQVLTNISLYSCDYTEVNIQTISKKIFYDGNNLLLGETSSFVWKMKF